MPPKKPSKRKAADGYALTTPMPPGEVLTDTAKRQWKIGKAVGTGGFGMIYLCSPLSECGSRAVGDDALHVVKIEMQENGPLFVEMHFFMNAARPDAVAEYKAARRHAGALGIPTYQGSGRHTNVKANEELRFLVMERFGSDLQKIFQTGQKPFSAKATYNIAIKLLDSLEYIHSKDYVHNDIKAQNILLGYGRAKENDIILVDFGLATKYVHKGVHKDGRPDARKAHDGTIEYTSRDAHKGIHARRSDLEILAYNLVHWMSGNLPWMDNLEDKEYVARSKESHLRDIPGFLSACFGAENAPPVLKEFADYAVGMDFITKPDYDRCRKMFRDALGGKVDGKVDFSVSKSPGTAKVGSPSKAKRAAAAGGGGKRVAKKSAAAANAANAADAANAAASPRKVVASPRKKAKKPVVVVAARGSPLYKDSGSQTSPAFVAAAASAAKAKRAALKAANGRAAPPAANGDPEMDAFVTKAVDAATKASAAGGGAKRKAAKSPARKAKKRPSSGEDGGIANPTPEMITLMKKKKGGGEAASSAAAAAGVDNPTPEMMALLKKRQEKEAGKKKAGKRAAK